MEGDELQLHYVATRDEGEELIARAERFWVANCGCREEGPGCRRSRLDVCLSFDDAVGDFGSGRHEVGRAFAEGLLREAEEKRLVVRPFRDDERTRAVGICFCCDDCCGYFKEPDKYECDKGRYVARTAEEACAACGTCVDACYFGARALEGDELAVDEEACYGCGLCADVCAEGCVTMAERV
jgi:Na+-translocating ferredoxin:NAD+ oxidoreductase RNF subunit RnfB